MESQDSDPWEVLVEKSLEKLPSSDDCHVIYPRVLKSLKNRSTEIFYIPHEISFGPYHFQEKNPLHDEIEVLKSQVAQEYNKRLNRPLVTVVQKFKHADAQIRKIYRTEFPTKIGPDVLSWMMVRDGCFLMGILRRFSDEKNRDNTGQKIVGETNGQEIRDGCFLMGILHRFWEIFGGTNEKEIFGGTNEKEIFGGTNGEERVDCRDTKIYELPCIDGILGGERYHPLLNLIVKDMFKIENQLPLWVLEKIVSEEEEEAQHQIKPLVESALKNLSPIEGIRPRDIYSNYREQHHILHMFHDYIVDAFILDRSPNIPKRSWLQVSIRSCGPSLWRLVPWVVACAFVLLVLSPVLVLYFAWFIMSLIWGLYQTYLKGQGGAEETHIPTVEELKKLGLKFKKLEGRGICYIKFEESNSTLHLPQFRVDDRSEVILRNLMALEIYSGKVEKPVTRYALLMNDLVNTSADVAILRHYDIITSKLGSDSDVAQLWNSMMVATEMPTYKPIDEAASRINRYRKKRWKILWAQFKMVHCSKPWLVLSLLGGTSLLMLTIVQVACLFRNCQI